MSTDPTNEPSSTRPPRWRLLEDRIALAPVARPAGPRVAARTPGDLSIIAVPAAQAKRRRRTAGASFAGELRRALGCFLALALLVPILAGCPGTGPTPASIDRVTAVGDATSQRFELVVQASDPGRDVLKYDWDLDGDGLYDLEDTNLTTVANVIQNEGTYTVACRVRDGDGGVAVITGQVLVRNVEPIAQVSVLGAVEEGREALVQCRARDAGGMAGRALRGVDGLGGAQHLRRVGVFQFEIGDRLDSGADRLGGH
jgi:hypothetical protein